MKVMAIFVYLNTYSPKVSKSVSMQFVVLKSSISCTVRGISVLKELRIATTIVLFTIYNNLLEQNFIMTTPNIAWVSDITYVWTAEGWLYLAALKDLCTKQVVGYSLSERMTAQLVCSALSMAIHNHKPSQGLIVHSDRGSQYCSHDYRNMIEKCGFQGSMSKKGDCYDNAPIESFWGILKNELVHHRNYKTREEAKADITKYIELFYNQRRIQKGLDFKTPNQMAEHLYKLAA